eukprot:366445-Chlamydomonas_euryale.AAC.1
MEAKRWQLRGKEAAKRQRRDGKIGSEGGEGGEGACVRHNPELEAWAPPCEALKRCVLPLLYSDFGTGFVAVWWGCKPVQLASV